MNQPDKSPDFTKIKPNQFTLNKGDEKFEVKEYHSSKSIPSLNMLLQGEGLNPQRDKRNALITAINMETGELIGKELIHFFTTLLGNNSKLKFQRRIALVFIRLKNSPRI